MYYYYAVGGRICQWKYGYIRKDNELEYHASSFKIGPTVCSEDSLEWKTKDHEDDKRKKMLVLWSHS